MRIEKYLWQNRRDFSAIYVCQFCGNKEERIGYDDDYFHNTVIPGMKCKACGKSIAENRDELDEEYRPFATKYPPNVVFEIMVRDFDYEVKIKDVVVIITAKEQNNE